MHWLILWGFNSTGVASFEEFGWTREGTVVGWRNGASEKSEKVYSETVMRDERAERRKELGASLTWLSSFGSEPLRGNACFQDFKASPPNSYKMCRRIFSNHSGSGPQF